MSSLVQRRDRKVKEGFSKKLPIWALVLIVVGVTGFFIFLVSSSSNSYR